MINIRRTQSSDLTNIMHIYEYAREKINGNPNQWRDTYPPEALIVNDIKNRNSYVIENDGAICGVFAFIIGDDPTYQKIEGQWKNNAPYGVIHRVASNGMMRGVFPACVKFCEEKISNIRVDTHSDNKIMQHQIEKNGFEKCGIIYVEDGSPRIAYHKVIVS